MGLLLDAISGITGAVTAFRNNQLQRDQMEYERDISERNYQFQLQNYEYQKEMQQKAWDREDNAVQRRVADLRAAGLSPTLAAGSAAATSSPIKIDAPQQNAANHVAQYSSVLGAAIGAAQQFEGLLQQKANISRTKAEENLINLNAQRQATENHVLADTAQSRINMSKTEAALKGVLYNEHISDSQKLKALGFLYGARSSDMVNFVNAVGGTQKAIEFLKDNIPNVQAFGQQLQNAFTDATGALNQKVDNWIESNMNKFFNTLDNWSSQTKQSMKHPFKNLKYGKHYSTVNGNHGGTSGRSF